MRMLFAGLVVSLSCASALAAPKSFEGVIEMKVTAKGGNGNVVISVGKGGMRSDMDMQTPQMPMKLSMLVKGNDPDTAYAINANDKTYTVVDLKAGREQMKQAGADEGFTAKKIGTEKVAGFDAVHAALSGKRGDVDVWTSKDILDYAAFQRAMGPNAPANEGMMKALKDVGAEGFIVKMVRKAKDSPEPMMTVELVKAEKKAVPASTFELPAGFTKSEAVVGGQLPPAAAAQLQEKMKTLTPAQQEAVKGALEGKQKPKAASGW